MKQIARFSSNNRSRRFRACLESLLLLLASPASPCPSRQSKVRLLSLFGGSSASSLFIAASNSIGQKDTTEQLALAHAGEPIWLPCTGKKILPEVSEPLPSALSGLNGKDLVQRRRDASRQQLLAGTRAPERLFSFS